MAEKVVFVDTARTTFIFYIEKPALGRAKVLFITAGDRGGPADKQRPQNARMHFGCYSGNLGEGAYDVDEKEVKKNCSLNFRKGDRLARKSSKGKIKISSQIRSVREEIPQEAA